MEFLTDDFDAIWRHVQECARDDAKKKNWIPSRRATKKNLIVEVGDTYLMLQSNKPVGDGGPRRVRASDFRGEWERSMGFRETGRMTNQATGDLIVRYFEDPSEEAWQGWGELFPDEEEGDAEPPVRTRNADSPGSGPTERAIPESRQKLEGVHRKIHTALKRDAAEAQDEWFVAKLPDWPALTPDLVVECPERSIRVIFEVKSASDWADVYEGVGQLLLYRELFWADYDDFDCYTALVVCGDPDEAAVMALDRLGIYLFVASCEGDLYEISPSISDFLDID